MFVFNDHKRLAIGSTEFDSTLPFSAEAAASASPRLAFLPSLFFVSAFRLLKQRGENASESDDQRDAAEGDGGHAPQGDVSGRAGLLRNVSKREPQRYKCDGSERSSENVKVATHRYDSYFSVRTSDTKVRRAGTRVSAMKGAWALGLMLMTCQALQSAGGQAVVKHASVPNVNARVDQLVKMDRAWGAEMTTPGMMLTMVETSRSPSGITYQLRAQGAPAGKEFVLLSWTLGADKPKRLMFGIKLDASGTAVCAYAEGPCKDIAEGSPLLLKFQTVPGEPVRVGLMSPDGTAKLLDEEVPTPLRVRDRSCMLDAVLLAPEAEVVLFQGTGFSAAEPLSVISTSNGVVRVEEKRADETGDFLVANLPKVVGSEAGLMTVTVKSASCSPSLTLPWGKSQLAKRQDDDLLKDSVTAVASAKR